METFLGTIAIAIAAATLAAIVFFAVRVRADSARLAADQAELTARLQQLNETQIATQAQLTRTLGERLDSVSQRLSTGLTEQTAKTGESLEKLAQRLAVIDSAQKNITELSQQVVGLQDILSNKQARGAFGELQLKDLVTAILPPSAYRFQAKLGNDRVADCLLDLPNPPGPIVIDAKFPLESYHELRNAEDDGARKRAERAFGTAVMTHVRNIADRYIVPGETAESALMFLPSEAVYAELHASLGDVVEKSYRARVWIVSPTTLWATLHTVRAVLKDVQMREQAGVIQVEVQNLLADVGRLDKRVDNLQSHFDLAQKDIREIRTSTDKITRKAGKIEEVQLGGETGADELPPPPPQSE